MLGDFLKVECMACIGGTSVREDISRIERGVQVIVGTPGRVFDMITRRHISTCGVVDMPVCIRVKFAFVHRR